MQWTISLRRGCLAAALALAPALALASAPLQKTQAPGYYRMMLGDFEITALSDGTVLLPMDKLLTHISKEKAEQAFGAAFLQTPIETSVNGYLVNTGSKLVLIDTGAGNLFGPTLGRLMANFKAAGYQPEQVDEIYITHMHPDHVGGLIGSGDKLAFPNAIVRADQREAAQWLTPGNQDKAPDDMKGMYKGALAALQPYVSAGRFRPFDGETQLLPGIRAQPSYGHTSGHTTYLIESAGQKLALLGDLMHAAAVQFPDPSVVIAFDTDSKSAAGERQRAFAAAAKGGYWIAAAHLAFPGIGHLRAEGGGYAFVPANYTSLLTP